MMLEKLLAAIRKHRDYRGDDRCYLDDEELYQALPEGYTPQPVETEIDLNQCALYKQCRKNPRTLYVSQQRRIEVLEAALRYYADPMNWCLDHSLTQEMMVFTPGTGPEVAIAALTRNEPPGE